MVQSHGQVRTSIVIDPTDGHLPAYNAAALEAAKTAIACAGYRVAGAGHHRISFDVVKLANGKAADPFSDYFNRRGLIWCSW